MWKHRLLVIFYISLPAISPALIHRLCTASRHSFTLMSCDIYLAGTFSLSLTLFLTSLSSLMPLLACLPSVWMEKRNYRTLPERSSASTPYLVQIKYLHNVHHLCQGKPSLPSFNVNMFPRQSLKVAPSLQAAPWISSSASSLLSKGRWAVF